jgi:transposase
MKPYSDDLRERVAAACAAGDSTRGQVAARFRVSLSFVNKLLQRQRAGGGLAALPHRGGPAPLLDEVARTQLAGCVARQPDATLAELRALLVAAGGPAAGCTTIWQALQQLDLRRKKRVCTPPSATPTG